MRTIITFATLGASVAVTALLVGVVARDWTPLSPSDRAAPSLAKSVILSPDALSEAEWDAFHEDWSLMSAEARLEFCADLDAGTRYLQECLDSGTDRDICVCTAEHILRETSGPTSVLHAEAADAADRYEEFRASCERWAEILDLASH